MSLDFWISTVIAIGGLIVAWYWGNRSVQRKRPTWATVTLNEVTKHASHLEGLEVLYRYHGQAVPQLSRSNLAFWNAGGIAIRASDAVPKAPLTLIALHGYHLLEVVPVQNTDDSSGLIVDRINDDSVSITFDHLEGKQGVVIQVIHTGLSDADINLTGSFIDADKLTRLSLVESKSEEGVRYKSTLTQNRRLVELTAIGSATIGVFRFIWGVTQVGNAIRGIQLFHNNFKLSHAWGNLANAMTPLVLLWIIAWGAFSATWRVRYDTRNIPRGLNIFQGILTELLARQPLSPWGVD